METTTDNTNSPEKRQERFDKARNSHHLALVEVYEGVLGYKGIVDADTKEIFNIWYAVKPGQEMNFDALKRERIMKRRLKQWVKENGIFLIVENPGEFIAYDEMEKSS